MPFIYDNLIATLISMTVLLILSSIQMEATQVGTATTSRSMVNTQAQQMASWVEEDLSRIGRNMPESVTPYTGPTDSTSWHTTEFAFEYVDSSGVHRTVQYDLEKTGDTVRIGDTQKEVVRVQRSPDGSSPALGYFDIDLLNRSGTSTAIADSIAFVRARFSVIAPFQNAKTFPRRVHRAVSVPYRPDQE